MSHLYNILLPVAVDQAFTYESATPLERGQLVEVPFRRKSMAGVVWGEEADYKGKVKAISRVIDLPPLPGALLDFLERLNTYYLGILGNTLRLCLNGDFVVDKAVRKPLVIGEPNFEGKTVELSPEQESAAQAISACVSEEKYQPFLLDGITGSGKTEVYLAAVQRALEMGKQVLVLLPEIALTSQWLNRFERRFGCAPLQWHSNLTESQRRQTWQAVLKGEARVVVGARSGLFLPFPNLGFMVVDEEHDGSFKQEEQVIYNARDMAVQRAYLETIPIALASATPSLETVQNVKDGRYKKLVLENRHGGAALPTIRTIDMRQQPRGYLSPALISAMQDTLDRGEQVMLFLNRRGYAPLTLCKSCGHRFMCPSCSAWLVEHRNQPKLMCHHCGYHTPMPKVCPECDQTDTLIPCGPGVERVHELVQKFFPGKVAKIITSDEVTSVGKLKELVDQITNHEIDILIGTQILAKGHHFPMITLVGVVDADLGLSGGDLRCGERTFQLLHQVSGRAGRETRPGTVLLQTFQPDHPIMAATVNQDRDRFCRLELEERQAHGMPPFGRLVSVTLSATNSDTVHLAARQLGTTAPKSDGIEVFGPVPAPIALVRGRHRWRILFKADKSVPLQKHIHQWLHSQSIPSTVQVTIDVDPYSFV